MPGARYPLAIDTDDSLFVLVNNKVLSLGGDITSASSLIKVLPGTSGLPMSGMIIIGNEVVYYQGHNGEYLTGCIRGYSNTTAVSHTIGAAVLWAYFAEHHNGLKDAIIAVQQRLGVPDDTTETIHERLAGLESASGDFNFLFMQTAPSYTWVITHDLGKYPSLTILNSDSKEIEADEVTHASTSSVVLTFTRPLTGKVSFN